MPNVPCLFSDVSMNNLEVPTNSPAALRVIMTKPMASDTYFRVACAYPAFTLHKIYPQVLKWRHKEIKLHNWNYRTKELIVLYLHSSLKPIKQLFSNPALPTVLNTMPMY